MQTSYGKGERMRRKRLATGILATMIAAASACMPVTAIADDTGLNAEAAADTQSENTAAEEAAAPAEEAPAEEPVAAYQEEVSAEETSGVEDVASDDSAAAAEDPASEDAASENIPSETESLDSTADAGTDEAIAPAADADAASENISAEDSADTDISVVQAAADPADTVNAQSTDNTGDAESASPAADESNTEEPAATKPVNQTVFIEFNNPASSSKGAKSHVDTREAGEKAVTYYIIGTSGGKVYNDAVFPSRAYLTFAQWILTDEDGNVVATSETSPDWSWDLNITGNSNTNSNGNFGIFWNIQKIFSKSELSLANERYYYPTNLFQNNMAKRSDDSKGVNSVNANKATLTLKTDAGQSLSVDFSNELVLYHKYICDAFGIVTTKKSSEIVVDVVTPTPTPEPTVTPTPEPTVTPTVEPTATPTAQPTAAPTAAPKKAEAVPTTTPSAKAVTTSDVPKTGESDMDGSWMLYLAGGLGGIYVLTHRKHEA